MHSVNESDHLLERDGDGETSAGIIRVVHIVAAIDVIDVEVIGVVPANWPGINETKPIAAVLEARKAADHNWVTHMELVSATKVGTETIIGDAAAAALTESKLRLGALRGHSLLGTPGSAM